MKKYTEPSIKVLDFSKENIVTASGGQPQPQSLTTTGFNAGSVDAATVFNG